MTDVCFRGPPDRDLRTALLSYETASAALGPYDIREPFENSIAVETVSLGAALSLVNDLSWYLARTTDEVLLRDPSVDPDEWLSRKLARKVRNGTLDPEETGRYLKVYGEQEGRLLEPMYVTRRDGSIPSYDLADVDGTVIVRLTEREFERA
ncbi:MAG: DUF5804 family protein [Halodesulfurarchaeum sp.]